MTVLSITLGLSLLQVHAQHHNCHTENKQLDVSHCFSCLRKLQCHYQYLVHQPTVLIAAMNNCHTLQPMQFEGCLPLIHGRGQLHNYLNYTITLCSPTRPPCRLLLLNINSTLNTWGEELQKVPVVAVVHQVDRYAKLLTLIWI